MTTPPKSHLDGLGRIKAFGFTERLGIRVLSPRMEPPDLCDDGSIALRTIGNEKLEEYEQIPGQQCLDLNLQSNTALRLQPE